jgi:hypothetical protein
VQLLLVDRGKGYVVTFTGSDQNFAALRTVADAVFASFTVG